MPDARRAPDPSAPSVLGRYHVLGEVGRDRIYITHLARLEGPSGFQRWAMVRRVRPEVAAVPGFRDAFYDAARASGRIDHPNVVATHDVGEEDGHLWMALEYVQGEVVEDVLVRTQRARTTVAWSIACKIVSDAALGVDGIHSSRDMSGKRMGLLHGHLAPRSLVVAYSGKTKVLDPCAPVIPVDVEASVTVSDDQSAVLPYMAPEQVWGEPVDARADVFSLGVVLWELCAGRRLFLGRNEDETRALLEAVALPALRPQLQGVPGAVDSILRRAVTREPRKRFDSAREFARTLQEVLVSQGVGLDEEEVARYMGRVFAERLEERERMLRQAADVTEIFRRGDLKLRPSSKRPEPPADTEPTTVRVPSVAPPRAPGSPRLPSVRPPPAPDTVRDLGAPLTLDSGEEPTMVAAAADLRASDAAVGGSDSGDEDLATQVRPPEPEAPRPSHRPPLVHAPSVELAPDVLAHSTLLSPYAPFVQPTGALGDEVPPAFPATSQPSPASLAATLLVPPRGRMIRAIEVGAVVTGVAAAGMVVLHWLAPFLYPPGTNEATPTASATPTPSARVPSLPAPSVATTASGSASSPVAAETASPSASAGATDVVATAAPSGPAAAAAPPPAATEAPTAVASVAPVAVAPPSTHRHRGVAPAATEDKAPAPSPTVPAGVGTGLLTVICIPACDQVIDGSNSSGGSPVYKVQVRAGAHKLTLRTTDPPVEKVVDTSVKADDITLVKVSMQP